METGNRPKLARRAPPSCHGIAASDRFVDRLWWRATASRRHLAG